MDIRHQHLQRSGQESKEPKDSGTKGNGKVLKSFQVVIRLCPQEQREPQTVEDARSSIQVKEPNRIIVDTRRGHPPHTLDFDAVWDGSATQKDIYESTAKPLVESLLKGYNGCVITYGSPACGKTYTLMGGSLIGKQRGILSRAAEDIFNTPESLTSKIRVSFIHVSNEKIYDLLESQRAEVCRIQEGEEAVFVEGLKEVEVGSSRALLQLYRRGAANRHTGVSRGEFAARSHSIFNIIAINTNLQESNGHEGLATVSKLTLVDLASSGKTLFRSGALVDGKRSFQAVQENPQEAKMLKRSLTIFGNVIFALSTAGCQHVPYRESKLTRVLRDCLGGNCRTSLIVTVSSSQSSVTETLSCLQFACRAMAIPGRPVHCSHVHYSTLQTQQVPQIQTQTCLPPIVSSPAHSSGCGLKRPEDGEQKAFLPQLERQGVAEGGPHAMRAGRGARPAEEKGGVGEGKMTGARCRSSSLVGFQAQERISRSEVHHSPHVSVDKLPPSLTLPPPTAMAPAPLECPNCKHQRKIRDEYDKYIVQARRDRDALNQRIEELEAQLLKRRDEESEQNTAPIPTTSRPRGGESIAVSEKDGTDDIMGLRQAVERQKTPLSGLVTRAEITTLEKDNSQKKQQIESLQRELEGLRAQLEECQGKHGLLWERGRAALDPEEIERGREGYKQQLRTLQSQKDSLMLELQDSKAEHGRSKENFTLIVNELQRQKDKLLSQVEETKLLYEKVKAENAGLREQVEALLRECSSRPRPDTHGHLGPPHVHTVTTNTEMLVVSHQVSRQCATGRGALNTYTALLLEKAAIETVVSFMHNKAEGQCCFNSCNGFQSSAFPGKPPEPSTMNDYDGSLLRTKDEFKQLKREHGLLLDVMSILYKRGWYIEDAIPYVQRTLRKCGLRLNDID